jgi:hypothetical protein
MLGNPRSAHTGGTQFDDALDQQFYIAELPVR